MEEKRKHSRIDSTNLLNYIYFDGNRENATQGMGRTLNVSESGIQIETHNNLQKGNAVALTIGFEEDMVDIEGCVIYSKKSPTGMFEAGIEFSDMQPPALAILKQYVEAFNKRSER